ncbi:MAG: protein-L-isoaspartate(D-aspartate) O-methyltransferase [Elusimicrobia bacterium]|nr:protein-L-isoaspartate(D-aspartate) O-methyltransferase [Elusimicrobiota bacterium]
MSVIPALLAVWACAGAAPEAGRYVESRRAMVERVAKIDPSHPISDRRVLDALGEVPRHLFVPKRLSAEAYSDQDIPIGKGQTIGPPFLAAYMTQTLEPKAGDKVLEVGTGSGYQAALLSRLVRSVHTIEIVPALAKRAAKTIAELGYGNVSVRAGDGYRGWPEAAPFDAIIVTCAPDHIPEALVDQLAMGGRLVIPIGGAKAAKWKTQTLVVVRKTEAGMVEARRLTARFAPMKGEAASARPRR